MPAFMTAESKREIVVEFERVQMIRKRAKTTFRYCEKCGGEKDFVGIRAAAELFEISSVDLLAFVDQNAVHHSGNGWYESGICIASLLEVMHQRTNGRNRKLVGD